MISSDSSCMYTYSHLVCACLGGGGGDWIGIVVYRGDKISAYIPISMDRAEFVVCYELHCLKKTPI